MITTSDSLATILRSGGFERKFVTDVIVDGDRVMQNVPLSAGSVVSDASARIRTQGSATLVWTSELGDSIVPDKLTSWMTPYTTFLNLSMLVSFSGFSEAVLQGTLKVVGVTDPKDARITRAGRSLSIGSAVTLKLADAFDVTDAEDFPVPTSPTKDTCWDEIGFLTGLPLLRNVEDVAIPSSLAYQDNRLDAVLALGTVLGGVPYMNPAGQVTLDPDTPGSEQEDLVTGPDGTISQVDPSDLTEDGIYNQTVVQGQDADQVAFYATSELNDDSPLRYGGPFGRRPYKASSQFITSMADAQAYADRLLPQVSTLPAVRYAIQCLPDPRREVGDVVPFERNGEMLVGRIAKKSLADTGLMTLIVRVPID